jgi:hypothetical protein
MDKCFQFWKLQSILGQTKKGSISSIVGWSISFSFFSFLFSSQRNKRQTLSSHMSINHPNNKRNNSHPFITLLSSRSSSFFSLLNSLSKCKEEPFPEKIRILFISSEIERSHFMIKISFTASNDVYDTTSFNNFK